MDRKYNPDLIHLDAGTYAATLLFKTAFSVKDEFYSKVRIFIAFKRNADQGYFIEIKDGRVTILEDSRSGGIGKVKGVDALYADKDNLGKVSIYFEGESVKDFPEYDDFWDAIKRTPA